MGQLFGWLALSCLLYGINAQDLVQCDSEKTALYCEECPGEGAEGCGGAGSDCFYYKPWDLCLNNEEKDFLVPGGKHYVAEAADYDYSGYKEDNADYDPADYDYTESSELSEVQDAADYDITDSSELAEVEDEEEMIDGGDAHEIVKRRAGRRRWSWKSPRKMPKKKQKSVRVKYNKPKKSKKYGKKKFRGLNRKGPKRLQKKKKYNKSYKQKKNNRAYKPKVGKSRMVGRPRPKFNLRDYYLRTKARGGRKRPGQH